MLPEDVKFSADSPTENERYFLTCGNKGILKIWSLTARKCVFQQPVYKTLSAFNKKDAPDSQSDSIVQAIVCLNIQAIAVVTADHNILLYDFDGLKQVKQVCHCSCKVFLSLYI